ncbi:hypothetical protein BC828DRAFT_403520 [Blastocladiella britannica]|nr:hypothetical protein BC828DRAFT_403520 [Blastocladiella britannica]
MSKDRDRNRAPTAIPPPEEGGDVWVEEYRPLAHIPDDAYASLMSEVEANELQAAMASSGPHRAPGPTGIQLRAFREAGDDAFELLRDIMSAALRLGAAGPFDGDITALRPITLLARMVKVAVGTLPTRALLHDRWPASFPSPNCPTCTVAVDGPGHFLAWRDTLLMVSGGCGMAGLLKVYSTVSPLLQHVPGQVTSSCQMGQCLHLRTIVQIMDGSPWWQSLDTADLP